MKRLSILNTLAAFLFLTLTGSVMAYQSGSAQNPGQSPRSDSRKMQSQVASGQRMKVEGTVLKRDGESFTMRQTNGSEMTVQMNGSTKISERKSNPFRGARRYSTADVGRGLYVEVEGRGDASGAVIADKIRFTQDSEKIAQSIDTSVTPVEGRMGEAENRLSKDEQDAQRLSGQVDELAQVANLAKGGAAAAQKTADAAVTGVNQTNDRITALDDYEEKTTTTINFKVGSALLSPDAKSKLDELASQAKSEQGFVVEVRGFASSDGGKLLNDRLSERRADAVVRYLAQEQGIPLRRIILPFGYGESMPVADNTTREGREQNRRVEIKILVSRGLTTPVNVSGSTSSGDAK